ncbi:MAG: hypothetical protein ACM3PE_00775 [Deltaproteobacteria bacterium]
MMGMSYKGWLSVGLKVLGTITLINGMVQAVLQWSSLADLQGQPAPWMLVCSIVVPIVTLGAGLYLLLGTRKLVSRLWPDQEDELESEKAVFKIAMKIMGMVLVVQALPEVVRLISNGLYIYSVSTVWDTSMQHGFIYEKLLSILLQLLIGCYLLFKGAWLQKVAFPAVSPED